MGAEPWFSRVFSPGVPCYHDTMTEIMKQAIAAASQLSVERQEELARYILALSHRIGDVPLGAEEAVAIAEAEAELARGERVPRDQIDAFWRRNGL